MINLVQNRKKIEINWSLREKKRNSKESDYEGTRTLNLPIRSLTPYPLGHAARGDFRVGKLISSMNCFLKQTIVDQNTLNSNHMKQVLL